MSRPKKPSPYDALMIRQLWDGGLPIIDSTLFIPTAGKKRGRPARAAGMVAAQWRARKRERDTGERQNRQFLIELHIAARLDEYAEVRGELHKAGIGGDGGSQTLKEIRKKYRNHPLKPESTEDISPYFAEILDRIGLPKLKK